MSDHWIVVNVGCIECGVSTNIVGVFNSEERAKRIADLLSDSKEAGWREGGQNHYEVFPMPPVNEVSDEYAAWLPGVDA